MFIIKNLDYILLYSFNNDFSYILYFFNFIIYPIYKLANY